MSPQRSLWPLISETTTDKKNSLLRCYGYIPSLTEREQFLVYLGQLFLLLFPFQIFSQQGNNILTLEFCFPLTFTTWQSKHRVGYSKRPLRQIGNKLHDSNPNFKPYLAVTTGFSNLQRVSTGLGKIEHVRERSVNVILHCLNIFNDCVLNELWPVGAFLVFTTGMRSSGMGLYKANVFNASTQPLKEWIYTNMI